MLVGLTGGIGCGKSTVLNLFKGYGWETLDADRICHEFYEEMNEEVIAPQIERWGKDRVLFKNGSVNRRGIADLVFNDKEELKWLNSLLHPLVMKKAEEQILLRRNEYVMFDVPLLYEAMWDRDLDLVITVWTDKKTQYERLFDRGWTKSEIKSRLLNQMNPDEKLGRADFGIINTNSLNVLMEQCKILNKLIRTEYDS